MSSVMNYTKYENDDNAEQNININGNIFNDYVIESDISIDEIHFFYDTVTVIEIILQERNQYILSDEEGFAFNSLFFNVYYENNERKLKLENTYNIFNQFSNNDIYILINLLLWLTLIINTGWFYVDLDDDANTDELYYKLSNIEGILMNDKNNLFQSFLEIQNNSNNIDNIKNWYNNWLNSVNQMKEEIGLTNDAFQDILESHITNLFGFVSKGNFEDYPNPNNPNYWNPTEFISVETINNFERGCLDILLQSMQTSIQTSIEESVPPTSNKFTSNKLTTRKNLKTVKSQGSSSKIGRFERRRLVSKDDSYIISKPKTKKKQPYSAEFGGGYTRKKQRIKRIYKKKTKRRSPK